MHLQLEIESSDRMLAFEVMNTKSLEVGATTDAVDGATIEFRGTIIRKAAYFPEIVEFVVEFGSAVAASVLAAWIIKKFTGRAERIRIDRLEVHLDEGEIERIIIEKIEKESK